MVGVLSEDPSSSKQGGGRRLNRTYAEVVKGVPRPPDPPPILPEPVEWKPLPFPAPPVPGRSSETHTQGHAQNSHPPNNADGHEKATHAQALQSEQTESTLMLAEPEHFIPVTASQTNDTLKSAESRVDRSSTMHEEIIARIRHLEETLWTIRNDMDVLQHGKADKSTSEQALGYLNDQYRLYAEAEPTGFEEYLQNNLARQQIDIEKLIRENNEEWMVMNYRIDGLKTELASVDREMDLMKESLQKLLRNEERIR